jgi:hypothetical protein
MDDRIGLTRRQVIWLLDRQVEGVDRAVADAIASTPQPKPSDSQARRIVEGRAGLVPFSLAAVRVATRLMTDETAERLESAMGYARSSIHPLDALPPHDSLPHPDLGGLRLWEGEQPEDEGSVDAERVAPILTAAFGLPGRDRLLLSRASGIDQTTLSRMTRGSCRGVTRANLRILAHVLGLSPRVFGLDGPANVDPPTARPDLRFAGPFTEQDGTVKASPSALLRSAGSYVLTRAPRGVLELTAPMREEPVVLAAPHVARESGSDELPDLDRDDARSTPLDPSEPRGHVRRIDPTDAKDLTTGLVFAVHPQGSSQFSLIGRMTTRRLEAIAGALDLPIDGPPPREGEAEVVDVHYVGDDAVAARAYAALTATMPAKRRRGWFAS